jgi:hypothetical protein
MLWETETFGIVMLTRNEEGGRVRSPSPLFTNLTATGNLNNWVPSG